MSGGFFRRFSFRGSSQKPVDPEQRIQQLEADIKVVERIIAHCEKEFEKYNPDRMEEKRQKAQEKDLVNNPGLASEYTKKQESIKKDIARIELKLASLLQRLGHHIQDPTPEEARLIQELKLLKAASRKPHESSLEQRMHRKVTGFTLSASESKAGICLQALGAITKAHDIDHEPLPPADISTLQKILSSETKKSSIILFPPSEHTRTKDLAPYCHSENRLVQNDVENFIASLQYTPPKGVSINLQTINDSPFTAANISDELLSPMLQYALAAKEQLEELRDTLLTGQSKSPTSTNTSDIDSGSSGDEDEHHTRLG